MQDATAAGGRTLTIDLQGLPRRELAVRLRTALAEAEATPRLRTVVVALGPSAAPAGGVPPADESPSLRELCIRVSRFSRAVIVAVRGAQDAWGLGLCTAVDLVVAGRSTTFSGSGAGNETLEDLWLAYLPIRTAKWLALGAGTVSAEEGLTLGFINAVTADERVLDEALALAERIGRVPPDVLQMKKAANDFRLALPQH